MSDAAIDSQGTKIYVGDTGSPPAYAEIVECRSINGPDGQSGWQDTTDLASTRKEGRPGLPDEGQIRLRLYYVPDAASHMTLRSAWAARTKKAFKIELTDTAPISIFEFSGYVVGFAPGFDVDNPAVVDVTIRITEAVTQVQ